MNGHFLQIQTRIKAFLKHRNFHNFQLKNFYEKHDGNKIRIDECKRRAAVKQVQLSSVWRRHGGRAPRVSSSRGGTQAPCSSPCGATPPPRCSAAGRGRGPAAGGQPGGGDTPAASWCPAPPTSCRATRPGPRSGTWPSCRRQVDRYTQEARQKAVSLVLELSCQKFETRNGEYGQLVLFPLEHKCRGCVIIEWSPILVLILKILLLYIYYYIYLSIVTEDKNI